MPGPFLARFGSLFLHTICYLGIESRVLRYYYQEKYKTKVLRVAPSSVSISDSEAIRNIHITSGGFPKDARYTNFNLAPVVSVVILGHRHQVPRNSRRAPVCPRPAPRRKRAERGHVRLVYALIGLNNFIRRHHRAEEEDIFDEVDDDDIEDKLLFSRPSEALDAKRDEIAEVMWADYQASLQAS